MPIKNRFGDLQDEITGWRQDFHQHPELLFDTRRTAGIIEKKLKEFGCDNVVSGIGRTGVVGVIRGKVNNSGKVIALRADMDALPIFEATGLPYASASEGKMHACGHDGHSAMLLGAAKYLAETRNFDGTALVIFQPAEEGGGGGRAMVEDGMMDRFDVHEVYGMHSMPGLAVGEFAIRPGPFFAATNQFSIAVEGRGGHAAQPHDAVDPTLAASHIVVALQSIVSRNTDPLHPVVVSVCTFRTQSEAYNVIPQHVLLKGTVRTLDANVYELVRERFIKLVKTTAAAFGATAAITYERGCPVMINSEQETEFAAGAARKVTGKPTMEALKEMGGDDFAFMLNVRPGAYILVGNGDSAMLHHPEYDFADEAIPAGCSYWVELIESRMPVIPKEVIFDSFGII